MALVAIPNIPPLVIPPPTGNPRVFLGERTGNGPYSWTGLSGDAAGLRGYEIVGRTDDAGAGGSIGLQFNADVAANYGDLSGIAATSAHIHTNGGNQTVSSVINIPIANSGARRVFTAWSPQADATPEIFRLGNGAFSWESIAAISRIDLIYWAGGPCTSAVWALYALMDVP